MPFIEWEDKYALGYKEIDEQHRRLFDLINELDEALEGRISDGKIVNRAVRSLIDYSFYHFETEEPLLDEAPPEFKKHHMTEHTKFRRKVDSFPLALDGSSYTTAMDLMNYCKYWLVNHILKTDMELGSYLVKS